MQTKKCSTVKFRLFVIIFLCLAFPFLFGIIIFTEHIFMRNFALFLLFAQNKTFIVMMFELTKIMRKNIFGVRM